MYVLLGYCISLLRYSTAGQMPPQLNSTTGAMTGQSFSYTSIVQSSRHLGHYFFFAKEACTTCSENLKYNKKIGQLFVCFYILLIILKFIKSKHKKWGIPESTIASHSTYYGKLFVFKTLVSLQKYIRRKAVKTPLDYRLPNTKPRSHKSSGRISTIYLTILEISPTFYCLLVQILVIYYFLNAVETLFIRKVLFIYNTTRLMEL